ncbi:unnamed protein product, partial [Symbiodinium pilosum]
SAYSCKFDGESPSGEQQTVTCVQPPANLCVTSWCVGSAGSLTCGPGNGNDPVCISGATGQDISNFAFFYTCCPGSATTTTTTTTTTTAVPSCVNEEFDCPSEVGFLPLQVINTGNRNNQNLVASIRSLDITTGQYSDVCEVQGVDLNACGLAQSNFIYCVARDSNEGEINPGQLVRVTCPLPTQEGPGVGSVCYLGLVQGRPFSGTTDTRVDSMLTLNGNTLFNYSNIDSLVANGLGWSFQNQSTENLPRTSASTNVPSSSSIADFVVLPDTTFEGDTGDWFVGCGRQNLPNNEERALVYVQLLGSNPMVSYDLSMVPAGPGITLPRGISGAQWIFGFVVFCAYNNGQDGVYQIDLNT